MKTLTGVLFFICLVCLATPRHGFSQQRALGKVALRFGGECELPTFNPSAALAKTIERDRRQNSNGPVLSGNEAVAFDLNGNGCKEYFVHLSCGATGNCLWGVYSDYPARRRGTFTAWFFYIHQRAGQWNALSTYTREGGDAGWVGRLAANNRGFYKLISEYRESGYYDQKPFYVRMGVPNCSGE